MKKKDLFRLIKEQIGKNELDKLTSENVKALKNIFKKIYDSCSDCEDLFYKLGINRQFRGSWSDIPSLQAIRILLTELKRLENKLDSIKKSTVYTKEVDDIHNALQKHGFKKETQTSADGKQHVFTMGRHKFIHHENSYDKENKVHELEGHGELSSGKKYRHYIRGNKDEMIKQIQQKFSNKK